jgi:hypothetical protein
MWIKFELISLDFIFVTYSFVWLSMNNFPSVFTEREFIIISECIKLFLYWILQMFPFCLFIKHVNIVSAGYYDILLGKEQMGLELKLADRYICNYLNKTYNYMKIISFIVLMRILMAINKLCKICFYYLLVYYYFFIMITLNI